MSQFQSKTIRWALEEIHSGHLLLPSFQREFVWKHEQVEMLFDSLMRGYPISSMLFWKLKEDSGRKFRFYRFLSSYTERWHIRSEEVKPYLSHADYAVLDGQQRLTALNIGLCGTYAFRKKYAWVVNNENNYPPRRLYLDISRRYDNDEDGKMYHFEFLPYHDEDLFVDGDKIWLRVGVVIERDKEARRAFAREHDLSYVQSDILDDLWDMVWEKETVSFYEDSQDDPDTAVEIFSRINSGGTRLYLSEILMAMTVANWTKRDARNEISGLVDAVNKMDFYIGGDYVLKAFLYLFHKTDVRFKIDNFDNDFISHAEEEWPNVKEAILELFRLMRYYGLRHSNLTSYYATLPVLYYLYHKGIWRNFAEGLPYDFDRTAIKRWLLRTLLLKTFGYRSDSALRASRRVLREQEWIAFPAKEIEQAVGQKVSEEGFYDEVLSYQKESRLAGVVLSLLYQGMTFDGFGYHLDHIHSAKKCIENGLDKNVWNSVLNLQMLSERENESKGATPLEEWVDGKTATCNREQFLESHLIPNTNLSIANFEEFIDKRKQLLTERLKQIL